MHKKDRNRQFTLEDFNQLIGLKMNPENRLVKKADLIPWDEIEERYENYSQVIKVCLRSRFELI